MGIFDSLESAAMQAVAGDQGKVAGGFMQALQEHPEGMQAVLSGLQNNGMAEHAAAWSSGAAQTATPDQVQSGLAGTGLLEAAAAKAGVSPEVASAALGTVLPMVMAHFAPNGQAPANSELSGLAGSLLQKFL
jgi:uncharacterized protein YidB (DUF937 family)